MDHPTDTRAVTIRSFVDSDLDFIISSHIDLYKAEYGLTSDIWKEYVRSGVRRLADGFDPERDCIYMLEAEGAPAGSIAITHTPEGAQLRFFLIDSSLRGMGLGKKMIGMVVDFCREKGYDHIFLWTFSKLAAARHLYARQGFEIRETHESRDWGPLIVEERWDLTL